MDILVVNLTLSVSKSVFRTLQNRFGASSRNVDGVAIQLPSVSVGIVAVCLVNNRRFHSAVLVWTYGVL